MMRFSPRAKILLYILLVIAVFVSNSFKAGLFLLCLVIAFAVRVPFPMLKRGLLPIMFFLTFTFVSNVFYQSGKVSFEIFGLPVTDEGLVRGAGLTLRLFVMILGAKVLTATTKADDLVAGMGKLLGPVGRLGYVKELMYTMSLTLRLLPIIYNEALKLYRDLKNSQGTGLTGKIRLAVTLLTPLFQRSLEKAEEISNQEKRV
ncbi:MAG: energy-coupling factor transporter transmembrane protein EcfT [Thermodesulfovibrionia bacterium]|nr:energy-coupling factor transporter transmembrane protein EcfT [Thermodesulfovibrionia bacterium]